MSHPTSYQYVPALSQMLRGHAVPRDNPRELVLALMRMLREQGRVGGFNGADDDHNVDVRFVGSDFPQDYSYERNRITICCEGPERIVTSVGVG